MTMPATVMAPATVSTSDVMKARAQLDAMRRSLANWLKYRNLNNLVASGARPSKLPLALAKRVMVDERDWDTEQRLADQLTVLLHEVMPDAALPNQNVRVNPDAAVMLAQIAISGTAPNLAQPEAQGLPWIPILIAGGLLLAFTTAVKTMADVAKEKERLKCVQSGACTDYGFWLKAGGIAALVYVAWNHLGVAETVKSYMPRKRA
jgi:hypothetical protein